MTAAAGLTPAGRAALRGHGIRTIVDLRNDDERQGPAAPGAAGLAVVHVPLDDLADSAFWRRVWDEGLDGTPLYYRPFLERKPERCAAAVAAVADAGPARARPAPWPGGARPPARSCPGNRCGSGRSSW